MWSFGTETASLKIEQNGPARLTEQGRYCWNLRCQLRIGEGGDLQPRDIELTEPFTPREYDDVAQYLDEDLDNPAFFQSEADETSKKIDYYRRALFKELKLCKDLVAVRATSLEIHIWPDQRHSQEDRSVNSIEWEQLEDAELWSNASCGSIQFVSVCRHFDVASRKRDTQTITTQPSHRDEVFVFDVLLVVARPHIHDARDGNQRAFSVLNPATIRSILLKLQGDLDNADSVQRINLEVVRPGCFEALEKHLEHRKDAFNGTRPYHVIHFDMHGAIREKRAFLEFNGYKSNHELGTENIYGNKLAPLLRRHQIECVILNACKTAVAHGGPEANLSVTFLQHGISAVLAMSHNMHDSLSNRFYSKFYHEFLVRRMSISVAASRARRELFIHRVRYNYNGGRKLRMQDWFIPVVYTSTRNPYRFPELKFPVWSSLIGIIFTQGRCLSLMSCFAIPCFLLGTLYKWIESRFMYRSNPLKASVGVQAIAVIVLLWLLRLIYYLLCHLHRDWRLRQWLKVLAEDRQNSLRLEGDLSRGRMVFLHSEKDVEDEAGFFLGSLAAIWERTHFVAFGGAISAEWFLQPSDLGIHDGWKLWVKAFANWLCLWVYSVRHRHLTSSKQREFVVIIKHLDILYPEPVELARMQYFVPAQERFEDWLKEHFPLEKKETAPYLLLTALRGSLLGANASKWFENGPGRCEVLGSIVTTAFAKISRQYRDPTNESFYSGKWYDWGLSCLCSDVSRPVRTGLLSALWHLPGAVISRTPTQ